MKYDDLQKLNELKASGAITEEEYEAEKKKILGGQTAAGQYWGMNERQYCMCLHLAQFANCIVPSLGWILPIVMWVVYKDQNEFINHNGKMAVNWIISSFIYFLVLIPLCLIIIGIPFAVGLGIASVVFIIIAAIKAADGQVWKYPLSIGFFS